MKQLFLRIMMVVVPLVAFTACEKDQIDTFDQQETAIRFPAGFASDTRVFPGYDSNLRLYLQSFSFLSDPFAEYADVDVPLIPLGSPVDYDRRVTALVVDNENNAKAGQYEILESIVPANELYGRIRIRVYNDESLGNDTRQLTLELKASDDFKTAPEIYLKARLQWNNSVTMPTSTAIRRTYNMIINSPLAWSSTSIANYSPLAHKVILTALDWDDLINSGLIMQGDLYKGHAKIVERYIREYNLANPDNMLRHDAGGLAGQLIEARPF